MRLFKHSTPTPSGPGIHNTNVIDMVSESSDGEICLAMICSREWMDLGRPLTLLQAKLNNYLGYALDGQLARDYPDLLGRHVVVEIRYPDPPDDELNDFVDRAARIAASLGIELRLIVQSSLRS